ncbi:hypothetical protein CYMTET_29121, partial [Cymbomonas tetramitiformis]
RGSSLGILAKVSRATKLFRKSAKSAFGHASRGVRELSRFRRSSHARSTVSSTPVVSLQVSEDYNVAASISVDDSQCQASAGSRPDQGSGEMLDDSCQLGPQGRGRADGARSGVALYDFFEDPSIDDADLHIPTNQLLPEESVEGASSGWGPDGTSISAQSTPPSRSLHRPQPVVEKFEERGSPLLAAEESCENGSEVDASSAALTPHSRETSRETSRVKAKKRKPSSRKVSERTTTGAAAAGYSHKARLPQGSGKLPLIAISRRASATPSPTCHRRSIAGSSPGLNENAPWAERTSALHKLTGGEQCRERPRMARLPLVMKFTKMGGGLKDVRDKGELDRSDVRKVPADLMSLPGPPPAHQGEGQTQGKRRLTLLRTPLRRWKALGRVWRRQWLRSQLNGGSLCRELGLDLMKLQLCVPFLELQEQCKEESHMLDQLHRSKRPTCASDKASTGTNAERGSERVRGKRRVRTERPSSDSRKGSGSQEGVGRFQEYQSIAEDCESEEARAPTTPRHLPSAPRVQDDDRKHLVLHRMLGTAMIHACLSNTSLLCVRKLRKQALDLELIPWEMPIGRKFSWFVSVFMVALQKVKGAGWLRRAQLLQMAFLQRPAGHFDMTQALANLLWVGEPEQPLASKLHSFFPLEGLRATVPEELYQMVEAADMTCSAENIWATMCAVALYEDHFAMAEWVDNPKDIPKDRKTLGQRAWLWLDRQLVTPGNLKQKAPVEKLLAQASQLVQVSQERHWERVAAHRTYLGGLQQTLWQRPSISPWALALFLISSHPLLALWSTPHSAQLTRAERIVLQVNNFFVMLAMVIWFTYTRSLECCEQLKGKLGCPDAGMHTEACVGFPTCSALHFIGEAVELLPEELDMYPRKCDAFPEPTLMGRLYSVACIVLALLPLNATLQALFVMSNSTDVPSHWRVIPKMVSRDSGKFAMSQIAVMMLHAVFTLAYALFENFEYFNKALALMIVGTINSLVNLNKRAVAFYRRIYLFLQRLYLGVGQLSAPCMGRATQENMDRASRLALLTVVPQVDGQVERLTYTLVFLFWGMLVWMLLVFQVSLREVIGVEATNAILTEWGYGLLMEHTGFACLRLIAFKAASICIGERFVGLLFIRDRNCIEEWYEAALLKKLRDIQKLVDETRNTDEHENEEGDAEDVGGGGADDTQVEDVEADIII